MPPTQQHGNCRTSPCCPLALALMTGRCAFLLRTVLPLRRSTTLARDRIKPAGVQASAAALYLIFPTHPQGQSEAAADNQSSALRGSRHDSTGDAAVWRACQARH